MRPHRQVPCRDRVETDGMSGTGSEKEVGRALSRSASWRRARRAACARRRRDRPVPGPRRGVVDPAARVHTRRIEAGGLVALHVARTCSRVRPGADCANGEPDATSAAVAATAVSG